MLIDTYLPRYHFSEFHSTTISSPVDHIYQKMLKTDLSRSFLLRTLFRLRGLPSRLTTIEYLENIGFIRLAENGSEILFGMLTNSPFFNSCKEITGLEFLKNSDANVIKAVINFSIHREDRIELIISTETRVWCGSKSMKWKFRLYWFMVKPFSQLIRKLMLAEIKKQIMASTYTPKKEQIKEASH